MSLFVVIRWATVAILALAAAVVAWPVVATWETLMISAGRGVEVAGINLAFWWPAFLALSAALLAGAVALAAMED